MTVLVLGITGQVGRALSAQVEQQKVSGFRFVGRDEIDFENNEQISDFIRKLAPSIIVNAAAWTAVDAAEDEALKARQVNATAVEEIAKAAKLLDAYLIHISTDYVYDGNKKDAYVETDDVNPQSVYGHTKLLGENLIRQTHEKHLILRTAWVFSLYGNNFVKTMLNLSERMDSVHVISDQYGCPTSANDIAIAILAIIREWQDGAVTGLSQTFHCVGNGRTNWANFARHIFETKQDIDGCTMHVEDISSKEWNAKAIRPANSVLDCSKLKRAFDIQMPCWKQSVTDTVKTLITSSKN